MSLADQPSRLGRLRRFARHVYEESGLTDEPVISGLIDLENANRWRHRP